MNAGAHVLAQVREHMLARGLREALSMLVLQAPGSSTERWRAEMEQRLTDHAAWCPQCSEGKAKS